MSSRNRSNTLRYTLCSWVLVLAVATTAMIELNRSAGASTGDEAVDVGTRAAGSGAAGPRHVTGPSRGASKPDPVGPSDARTAAMSRETDSAALAMSTVVEGSAAERASSGTVGRAPERAARRGASVPIPEPRSADHPWLTADGPHRVALPALPDAEIERLERAARIPGPLEVGPVRDLARTPAMVALPVGDEAEPLQAFAVRSEGAASMRLHFSRFDVGEAEVLVYASNGDDTAVLGPFTGRGPRGQGAFWTGVLPGDEVVVEVSGGAGAVVEVDQALHAQLGFGSLDATKAGDGLLTCHEDVQCHSVDQVARDAVGQLSYMSGGAGRVCSGTLLADLDDETEVPYLLTARHCISTQSVADTLTVTWLYQTSSCGGAAPNFWNMPMSTSGADVVRTNSGNDMALLRLRDPAPPGVGFAGWTTNTGVGGAHGVHHPRGDYKRYAELEAVGFCPNCTCNDPTDYDFYDMQVGQVQGGSSGSPVFDAQGRVAGQLRGRCAKNYVTDPDEMTCGTTDDYWAIYGEFQTTHGKIKRWLEIGGTIRVDADAGSGGKGTPSDPFGRLADAESFAWRGSRIKLRSGDYAAPVELTKEVTLLAEGGVVTIGQ